MRVLKATLAVAIVLGLAGAAAAQSLGELAAQEKQKRQGKPAPKTITESDLARAGKNGTLSMSGSPEAPGEAASQVPADGSAPAPEAAAPEAPPPAEGTPEGAAEAPAEGTPPAPEKAPEPVKPKGPPAKTADELRTEAKAEMQKKLDLARTNLTKHQDHLDRITTVLNQSAGDYSQARADLFKKQDEEKQAIAKGQADIAQLEEDVRRSAWPR